MGWLKDAWSGAVNVTADLIYGGAELVGLDDNLADLPDVSRAAATIERGIDAIDRGEVVDGAVDIVKGNLDGTGVLAHSTAHAVAPRIMTVVDEKASDLKHAYNMATNPGETLANDFWNSSFGQFLSNTWESITDFFSNMGSYFSLEGIGDLASGVMDWFGDLFEQGSELFTKYVSDPIANAVSPTPALAGGPAGP